MKGSWDRERDPLVALSQGEVGLFEDAQVLHDPEPGHLRQVPAQLPERLAIALEEPIEERPPTLIG